MQSLSVTAPAAPDERGEIENLKIKLEERRRELTELQKEFREFKARYAQIAGSGLAELAEVEREIRRAEARLVGKPEEDEQPEAAEEETESSELLPVKKALRRLFWSVAKVFHPDHAADDAEAQRRHHVMAEASRAYREGDADSLHTLLDDAEVRSYCAAPPSQTEVDDLPAQRFRLKEEIRTVEFGIKRITQDHLYLIKLKADEEAEHGRDALLAVSERTRRQIVKARRRLEHLS